MKHLQYLTILIFFALNSFAVQAQISVGNWREHLPYQQAVDLDFSGDLIYVATKQVLFIYDMEDGSVERFSTLDGLSDVGISAIAYHKSTASLFIAYENANIDIIAPDGIFNFSDIKRSDNISGEKSINAVHMEGDFAYLSCGFGIVAFDMKNLEFGDTYYIGDEGSSLPIHELTILNNHIFAATDEGVRTGDLADPALLSYQNWTTLDNRPDSVFNSITNFNGKIYANKTGEIFNTDSIFVYDNTSWDLLNKDFPLKVQRLSNAPNNLIATLSGSFLIYNDLGNIVSGGSDGDTPYSLLPSVVKVSDNNRIWMADGRNGLMGFGSNGFTDPIFPSGPIDSGAGDIAIHNGDVWVAHDGRDDGWFPIYNTRLVSKMNNQIWEEKDIPEDIDFRDMVTIEVDPRNPENVYAGTWGYGIVNYENGEFKEVIDDTNSSLTRRESGGDIFIGGIDFDKDGNMWVTNSQVAKQLAKRDVDGEWESVAIGGSTIDTDKVGFVMVDSRGYKWVQVFIKHLVVYNEETSIRSRQINSREGSGNLASDVVWAAVEDLNGDVWVGTDGGVSVFYNPQNILEPGNNYDASSVLVEFDGFVEKLLDGEKVYDIAIDGANRKWFATSSGVYLTSADGTEEIQHFTAENSPLLDNSVKQVEIDPQSGEVFFGTEKGMISYKADATEGGSKHSNVYAYPNPVKSGYDGQIAINGLVSNASVKITDVSGNLIYETTANGGRAVWNGRNFDGDKAHTGVYLIFSSDSEGTESNVAKILFVN